MLATAVASLKNVAKNTRKGSVAKNAPSVKRTRPLSFPPHLLFAANPLFILSPCGKFCLTLALMKVSARMLTWALRLYPPLLFQRIWVRRFHDDFCQVDINVARSVLNRNSNGSIFGGTIFAATDPFYALLFDQLFKRKGYDTVVWLKSSSIRFVKPAYSSLSISIRILPADIEEAEAALRSAGKFTKTFRISVIDRHGVECALAENEVYIRDRSFVATDAYSTAITKTD